MHGAILTVGKLKNAGTKILQEDYLSRLQHYSKNLKMELVEVADGRESSPIKRNAIEGEVLLKQIKSTDHVVLLDEKGKQFSSIDFSKFLNKIGEQGIKRVVFVIGGPFGVNEAVRKRASTVMSLSAMTLPHELARVLLLEQIYRACTILKGEKYHHE